MIVATTRAAARFFQVVFWKGHSAPGWGLMVDVKTSLVCPKCGAPRLEHAWDCVKCGTVFPERAHQGGEGPVAEKPSSPKIAPREMRSGSIRVRPARGGLAGFRRWVDEYTWIAIVLALGLFVATMWAYYQVVASSTESPEAVKRHYREIVGGFPPSGFTPVLAGHLVGRRLVMLQHDEGLMLYVYTQRWPADRLTAPQLEATADRIFRFLFEQGLTEVSRGHVAQGSETITVRVLRVGGEGGGHLYLFPIHGGNGEPAMVALMGPQKKAREMAREIVERF